MTSQFQRKSVIRCASFKPHWIGDGFCDDELVSIDSDSCRKIDRFYDCKYLFSYLQNGLASMEESTNNYRTIRDVSSMPEIVVETRKRIRRPSVILANVSADSCHQKHNANLIYRLIFPHKCHTIVAIVSHKCHIQ